MILCLKPGRPFCNFPRTVLVGGPAYSGRVNPARAPASHVDATALLRSGHRRGLGRFW